MWVDTKPVLFQTASLTLLCLNDFIIGEIVTYAVTGVNNDSTFLRILLAGEEHTIVCPTRTSFSLCRIVIT